MPGWLSHEVKDLLRGMLTVDPAKRLALHQVFAHPALAQGSLSGLHSPQFPLEEKVSLSLRRAFGHKIK